jgi:Tol biopolymer transport system component
VKTGSLVVVTLVGLLVLAAVGFVGCGGDDGQAAFFTVSERCSYGPNSIIAFAAFGGNALRYINAMNERGGSVTALTPSDNDDDLTDEGGFHPAYSPDGATLAMAARRGPSEDIFLIAAAGGDRARLDQLTNDPAADIQPTWSPTGDRIVFTTDRDGDYNLYVMPLADPTQQTAVTTDPADDEWASFAPDGNRVAFQSNRSGNTDIWIIDLTTQAVTQVTNSAARDEHPAWSPDGAAILFTSNRAGDFDIWSIAPDGTGLTQITADGRSDGYPQWRPDGTRICITRDRQLWLMDPDGANEKQMTRTF